MSDGRGNKGIPQPIDVHPKLSTRPLKNNTGVKQVVFVRHNGQEFVLHSSTTHSIQLLNVSAYQPTCGSSVFERLYTTAQDTTLHS